MSIEERSENRKRVGVYVCQCGGNISDVVDCDQVIGEIQKNEDVEVAKNYIFMCSDGGQNLILEDIKLHNLTHIIVAACSPSLHELTFRDLITKSGLNPYMYEHVNLREQISWVHSHHPEEATAKAVSLIEGAIARVTRQEPLLPIIKKTVQNGIVIGGGISGLTAALDLARNHITVDLIEKSPFLGGRVVQLTTLCPNDIDALDTVHNLIEEVTSNEFTVQIVR